MRSIIAIAGAVAAAMSQPTFRVATEAVLLDVAVSRHGKPAVDLRAADFVVSDDGVRQTVADVSEVDSGHISIVLVLDTSGSVAGERLARLLAASNAVIDDLRPNDQAAVITFADEVALRSPFTRDHEAVKRTLTAVRANGSTTLCDALWVALHLKAPDESRPVVLLFTDGVDNSSWISASQALDTARQAGTVIHAIGFRDTRTVTMLDTNEVRSGRRQLQLPTESTVRIQSRGSAFLEQIAAAGGGRSWLVQSPDALRSLFLDALNEMRSRYIVTFYPSGHRAGWHDLKVTVRGAEVLTRQKYFVASER
jgi:VWFA-related protein